jgi:hypothetical protein
MHIHESSVIRRRIRRLNVELQQTRRKQAIFLKPADPPAYDA